MVEIKNHVFYNVRKLSQDKKKEIMHYAKRHCNEWWADETKASRRVKFEIPFAKMVREMQYTAHFVVIHRRGYYTPNYGEVGFSSNENPVKHLWINIDESRLEKLVNKFELFER